MRVFSRFSWWLVAIFELLEVREIFWVFVIDVDFRLLWLVSALFICTDAKSDAVDNDSFSLSALFSIGFVLLLVVFVDWFSFNDVPELLLVSTLLSIFDDAEADEVDNYWWFPVSIWDELESAIVVWENLLFFGG